MSSSRPSRLQVGLLVAVLLFIVVGTLLPVEIRKLVVRPFPRRLHADLIGHFMAFAALAFLLVTTRSIRPQRVLLLALVLAIGTEAAQFFVPGRTPLLSDVAVDVIGAAVGLGLAWLWARRNRPSAGAE